MFYPTLPTALHPISTDTTKPGPAFIVARASWMAASSLVSPTGCITTTGSRAQEKSAVFGQLPPTDQTLVPSGTLRPGLSREAAYVAWGPPTAVFPANPDQGPREARVYSHAFYGNGGHFGAIQGLVYSPARHRYFHDGNDHETPVYRRGFGQVSAEVPRHRAWFDHGRVVSFESLQNDPAPTPGHNRKS